MTNNMSNKILEHVIEIKESQAAQSSDIKHIRIHLAKLNGTVADHETKIGNIRVQMAKWLGGAAVIVILAQLLLKFIQ